MKLINILPEEVKVGDFAVISTLDDDVYYSEIVKMKKTKLIYTNGYYTCLTLKNGDKFSFETSQNLNSKYRNIIGYKRYDDEIVDLVKDIKRLKDKEKESQNKIAHDLTLLIEKYCQENNISRIAFNFSSYSNECNINIHVQDNKLHRTIDELIKKYEDATNMHYN